MKLKQPIANLHPSELRIAGGRACIKRKTKKTGKKTAKKIKKQTFKMILF